MTDRSPIVKILFLAANPSGTERRSLDEEIRRIELALERAKKREQFKIIQKWAVTDDDLRRALLDHEPEVVHFSGHGGGAQGLAFVDSQGRLLVISGDSLARLFELCADHVRCVILNACFSDVQAKVISRHIEIVVGMSQDIGDEASIKFSEGFYDALGAGRSAERAFEFGRSAIDLRSLREHLVPIILRNPEIRSRTRASTQGDGPRRIVPRGLRSFQAEDSDFFLELIPGPRGHDGLPTNLRFWKTRIEDRNPDRTFPVGLIYGPSGCGKSSLVKAGLLPRLSDTIHPVIIEATADDTETRLLKGLRGAFPGLGSDLNLIDAFITLRRETEATGDKTLIVIDQFEQWLHAKTEEEKSELALSLRLCDGANIQCILMIRDDFWLGTNRLMKEIGVRISEGENAALVDLFDVRHARKVLGLFADAYGVWDDSPVEPTERARFLDDAVSGLAEDERVICVRIALFCELFQGKPWDLKSLETAGGVEGVGVLFMEETFSAVNAPAENRYHQKAVRSMLNALLPEPGSKIKGRMRSDQDLIDVSGYADRPADFQALVRILDEKTHLITPTDPEGLGAEERGAKEPSVGRFYQLTHDYLVPSIREWLTCKQRETRRGRAELRLAERSAIWAAKPENRHLPSLLEWTNIRLLTRKRDWDEPQRRMMRKAGWFHGSRTLASLILLGLLTWGGIEGYGTMRASSLVESLRTASTTDVPALVRQIDGYRRWANPRLKTLAQNADDTSREKLHGSLALLPIDASHLPFLEKRLLNAIPAEVPVVRDTLEPHRSSLIPKLWSVLDLSEPDDVSLLPAASALVLYDPTNERWAEVIEKVAKALVSVNSIYLGDWLRYLRDMRSKLNPPLATIFRKRDLSESDRTQVTNILADYASDDPDLLAELMLASDERPFAVLFEKLEARKEQAVSLLEEKLDKAKKASSEAKDDEKDQLAQRQARAAVALVRLGQGEEVWQLLRHSPDPSVRSYIVNWLKPLAVEPMVLFTRLESLAHSPVSMPQGGKSRIDEILFQPGTSERRALILAMGTYGTGGLSADEREPLTVKLLDLYRNDPDAGIHGAAEWALRQWKEHDRVNPAKLELTKLKDWGDRRWFVNSQGQTMVIIEGPVRYRMGSPSNEPGNNQDESIHEQSIPRRLAISAYEVTADQYEAFLNFRSKSAEFQYRPPTDDGPVIARTWYEAAEYCDWLNEVENKNRCYDPADGVYKNGMMIPDDQIKRRGYRLPTEAEWEYACRSGAVTSRYFGDSVELLPHYAWFTKNSEGYARGCGSLLPNDLGLFDTLGNVQEWCQDRYERPRTENSQDTVGPERIGEDSFRVIRGGTYTYFPAYSRSASRDRMQPSNRYTFIGFRLAITLE